jgi:acyl carrier protein
MTPEIIKSEIRQFMADNFIFDPSIQLVDNESFIENGIVDSTGVLEVIMWLESTYGVSVLDNEVLPENLDSVDNLLAYIERKQGARAEGTELLVKK